MTFPRATLLGTSGTENPNNTALNGLRTGWTGAARALWVVLQRGDGMALPCPRHVALFMSRSLSGTLAFRKSQEVWP